MSRLVHVIATVSVLAACLVPVSLAAQPQKGATYEGTLYASGTGALTKQVRVTVAANGTSARVSWKCGTGRAPSSLRFTVAKDGSFKAYSNTGKLTVWSFVGRFVSPQRAQAVLHLNATCDAKGGKLKLVRAS